MQQFWLLLERSTLTLGNDLHASGLGVLCLLAIVLTVVVRERR